MAKVVFLDTNVYLHYQDIDQIDWLKIVQADTVTIVVPPIVIRELNKHKDSHTKTRVRKRAGAILKMLSTLFASGFQAQLRSNVAIYLEDRELIDFGAYQLSREIQDDNLIASLIMYRHEWPEAEIIVVTSDAGLTLLAKANRYGIAAMRLPDSFKLPEEPDPEQKRISELEQEIRELKLRIPRLSLTFEDRDQYIEFILSRPVEIVPAQIEEEIDKIRKRYPKREMEVDQASKTRKITLSMGEITTRTNRDFLQMVPPEEIENYNTELETFYQAYADYLRDNAHFQNLKRRTIKVEIALSNDGSAPAEDIDVFMQFPGGPRIRNEDHFPRQPPPPTPPPPPKTAMEKLGEPMAALASALYPGWANPVSLSFPSNVSSPEIGGVSGQDVGVHVQRIKHKLREPFDPLYLTFESWDAACSFQIKYRILAANLPNEINGTLHIIIQKEV